VNNAWADWDTGITDGAALRVLLSCEAPFTFDGVESSTRLEVFAAEEMDRGPGADVALRGGASAGRALKSQPEEPSKLYGLATSFAGAGVVRVRHDDPTSPQVFHPDRDAEFVEDVPP